MEKKTPVLNRMGQQLQAWNQTGDQRQIFLNCYQLMTGNMLTAIETGRFRDRAWVQTLLEHFADYYFDALACYDCGEKAPPVWQQVHSLTREKELHVLQCLLLGINAHINYDLVLTLVDMLQGEWEVLSEADRQKRYADHCLVNQIIAETIDRVQDEVIERYDPVMEVIDRTFGRLDEFLLSRLISRWRKVVWDNAQIFLAAEEGAPRELKRRELEAEVMHRARLLAFSR